jgi:hypothetical protein
MTGTVIVLGAGVLMLFAGREEHPSWPKALMFLVGLVCIAVGLLRLFA